MEKELQAYIVQFFNEIWKINKKLIIFVFKCKFEKFLMCLHIKVSELNTLSDGKGITGIHSAVF